jgi:hypothetical protein
LERRKVGKRRAKNTEVMSTRESEIERKDYNSEKERIIMYEENTHTDRIKDTNPSSWLLCSARRSRK